VDPVTSAAGFFPSSPLHTGPASHAGSRQDQAGVAPSHGLDRDAPSPQLDQLAISRVLLNAECLIASIIGLSSHRVSVNVSISQYGA
jgi:hypothetical protein